jgi:hypothetical protein
MILWLSQHYTLIDFDVASATSALDGSTHRRTFAGNARDSRSFVGRDVSTGVGDLAELQLPLMKRVAHRRLASSTPRQCASPQAPRL